MMKRTDRSGVIQSVQLAARAVAGVLLLGSGQARGAEAAWDSSQTDTPISRHEGLTAAGAVGLPLNPTAQIPARGRWSIQGQFFDLGDVDVSEGLDFLANTPPGPTPNPNTLVPEDEIGDGKLYGIHIAGRVTDWPLELSIGVDKLSIDESGIVGQLFNPGGNPNAVYTGEFDELDKTGIALGAKWLFNESNDDPDAIRIAAGVGYQRALLNNYHAYVVASKPFHLGKRSIVGHLGVRYDRFEIEGTLTELSPGGVFRHAFEVDDESSKVSVYTGAEISLSRSGKWSLIGELQTKNSDFKGAKWPYSLGVRYQNNRNLWATIGIQRQGVLSDDGLYVQLGYAFGGDADNAGAAASVARPVSGTFRLPTTSGTP